MDFIGSSVGCFSNIQWGIYILSGTTYYQGCGSGCFSIRSWVIFCYWRADRDRNRVNTNMIRHPDLIYPDDTCIILTLLSKVKGVRMHFIWLKLGRIPVVFEGRIRIWFFLYDRNQIRFFLEGGIGSTWIRNPVYYTLNFALYFKMDLIITVKTIPIPIKFKIYYYFKYSLWSQFFTSPSMFDQTLSLLFWLKPNIYEPYWVCCYCNYNIQDIYH